MFVSVAAPATKAVKQRIKIVGLIHRPILVTSIDFYKKLILHPSRSEGFKDMVFPKNLALERSEGSVSTMFH
jgi:hypothetical protein